MKKTLLMLGIIFIFGGLLASELDTGLDRMFQQCSQVDHNGLSYLLADDYLASENDAYEYVAWNSAMILCSVQNWLESSYGSRLGSVDGIAAAWPTDYQDFVVSIPFSEIKAKFGEGQYDDFNDLASEIRDYVDNYGDVGSLDNFED
jgi:hypothetical protein